MVKDTMKRQTKTTEAEATKEAEGSADGSTARSEGFQVEDFHVETDTPDENDFEAGGVGGVAVSPAVAAKVNEAMLEVAFATLSKIAVALTGYQEVGLDDDEVEQLVGLWSPIMPGMSPIATAILGTTMIVSSKTFLYLHLKRKANNIEATKLQQKTEGENDVQSV